MLIKIQKIFVHEFLLFPEVHLQDFKVALNLSPENSVDESSLNFTASNVDLT